jgi:hypothetical protein
MLKVFRPATGGGEKFSQKIKIDLVAASKHHASRLKVLL